METVLKDLKIIFDMQDDDAGVDSWKNSKGKKEKLKLLFNSKNR